MLKLLILDFDGTITDAEAEGIPYREGYFKDIAILCGAGIDDIMELANEFENDLTDAPDQYGWGIDGKVIAPAAVDPYLRVMPVARKIFDRYGVFMKEPDRSRLLDSILYKYNYLKTKISFRDNAENILSSLKDTNTWIVTNSHTDPVKNKIIKLAEINSDVSWLTERVIGRAKKYIIDDTFEKLPETMKISGLDRVIYLRRRQYFEILNKLRKEYNAEWRDVTVIGDIFELDLALPWFLGAQVGLMVNKFTPEYEKKFFKNEPTCHLLSSLNDIKLLMSR